MRILVISPFPPLRDGVGKYAAQEVRWLRDEGHEVEVLAPVPCAAHYVEELKGGFRFAKVRRYARRYDRVILQYQPSHYHTRGSGFPRILSNLVMFWVFWRTPNLTVVCHEIEYPPPTWPRWRPETILQRWAWSKGRDLVFHTERELRALSDRLGARPRSATVRPHGGHFTAAVTESRDEARMRLKLPAGAVLFLCIGFIQRHKGFDRAVRALRRIPAPDARLVVVGSLRSEEFEHRGYLNELTSLAGRDERVTLLERMVSDEDFDRWICASDVVVLPYREIWSSGVFERAKLLDRPVIATDVGGLIDQARPEDVVVADDESLAKAMAAACGSEVSGPPGDRQQLTVADAQAIVDGAIRTRATSVPAEGDKWSAEALANLDRVPPVHPVVLPSPRPIVGPLVTLIKRVLRRGAGWYTVPMLGQINEFERQAVEAIRATADAAGELRREIEALHDRVGGLAWDQDSHRHHHEATEPKVTDLEARAGDLERRTRGLADVLASGVPTPSGQSSSVAADYTAIDYHAFESHFRGDPADVRRMQSERYIELFHGRAPVVDVGCGRGEFLDLLRDADLEARGVDLDLDMVTVCRERGLDVVQGDAIAFLEACEEGSVGGVFGGQLVEHLPPRAIVALLAAARRALRPDGILVLDTINPSSLYALANWYMMDLTHAQPVHPDTLRFLAKQEGFRQQEIRFYAPVRREPVQLGGDGDVPAWAAEVIERIEAELQRFEAVVFGPQDYALIARP